MRELIKDLNPTPDQAKVIREAMEEQRTRMQALRDNTSLSREDRRKEFEKIHEESAKKIRAVLDEDQKKKFDEFEKKQRERMRDGMRERRGQGNGEGEGSGPPPPPPPATPQQ